MLAGHMRVGPQYRPPNPHGAQVIQRGPHGARLAPDPVLIREGERTGEGFQFWLEDSPYLNKDLVYMPKQFVVGVYGLGDVDCPPGAPSFPRVSDSRSPEASLLAELNRAVQAVCNGRLDAAQHAVKGAKYFVAQVNPQNQGKWVNLIGATEGYIARSTKGAEERRRAAESRELERAKAIEYYNKTHAQLQRDLEAGRISLAQFSQAIKKTRRDTGEIAEKVVFRGQKFFEDNWWKFALLGGVVFFFYGAGRGLTD